MPPRSHAGFTVFYRSSSIHVEGPVAPLLRAGSAWLPAILLQQITLCAQTPARVTNFKVVRAPWRPFVPMSLAARLRIASVYHRFIFLGVALAALYATRRHYGAKLAAESPATDDRISRKGFVLLPDGRLAQVPPDGLPPCQHPALLARAQVWPQVDVRMGVRDIFQTLCESLNPVP